MKRIPWPLETALIGSIPGGHDFEFYPLKKEISFVRSDDDQSTHVIDFYDGLAPLVFIEDEDRTLDVVRAIGAMIGPAARIAGEYELAASEALKACDEALARFELSYVKAAEKMRAYSDALYELKPWYAYQIALAELRAREAKR